MARGLQSLARLFAVALSGRPSIDAPAAHVGPTPLVLDIESLDQEGRGVARVDGKAVFVDGALPGERRELHDA